MDAEVTRLHPVMREVTLRYTRHPDDDGLGMELGVEASGHSKSGRLVVVRSLTPEGPAVHAEAVSVSVLGGHDETGIHPDSGGGIEEDEADQDGFRVRDRVVRIDDHVLDDLCDDDCLAVLRDISEDCLVVVERSAMAASPETATGQLTATAARSDTEPPKSPPTWSGHPLPQEVQSLHVVGVLSQPPAAAASRPTSSRASSGVPPSLPRPQARKVRRAQSTASHLAEQGLPGFQVRRVAVRRQGGQGLGISIVPSFGATKFYYQVKRLLPGGVGSQCPALQVGDRLLECNGQSLQHLTQSQCLDILKNAGPRVTLTLLHELSEAEEAERKVEVRATAESIDRTVGDFGTGAGDRDRSASPAGAASPRRRSLENSNGGRETLNEQHRRAGVKRTVCSLGNGREGDDSQPKVKTASVIPTMSGNPFLDSPPPPRGGRSNESAEHLPQRENGVEPLVTPMSICVSKSNPFYNDIFGNGVQEDDAALIDDATGLGHFEQRPSADSGVAASEDDVLLDLGMGVSGGFGDARSTWPAGELPRQGDGGSGVDLLGSFGDGEQFREPLLLGIPPPAEFSDLGGISSPSQLRASSADPVAPVTNIDDLLGLDFGVSEAVSEIGRDEHVLDGGFGASVYDGLGETKEESGLLLDVQEAAEKPRNVGYMVKEDDQFNAGPVPRNNASPPPAPSGPPPPIPVDDEHFPEVTDSLEDLEVSIAASTSVFIPSDDPLDNVSALSVPSEPKGSIASSTVHKTNIVVTSPNSKVTSVKVTKANPVPRGHGGDSSASPSSMSSATLSSVSGATVLTIENSGLPTAAQILFDNSTQETVVRSSSVPVNSFLPTSIAVTRGSATPGDEELITPMSVHRDHLGNKLAAPAPPETLGRSSEPDGQRQVDEVAKRDLKAVLSQMDKSFSARDPAGPAARENDKEKEAAVDEDDIVPIKLTHKQAETARHVLDAWTSGEPESKKVSSPLGASSSSSSHKSGFQKAVGTIVDVKSGKIEQLPSNSVFLTTIGVTKPSGTVKQAGDEFEEEITPMTVYKNYIGTKHYAPTPPECLGRQTEIRQVDFAATQAIAALMAGMAEKTPVGITARSDDAGERVSEDEIVATVLTQDQQRSALAAVSKWLNEEPKRPPAKTSAFSRLVDDAVVMDSAASSRKREAEDRAEDTQPSTTAQKVIAGSDKESAGKAERAPEVPAGPALRKKRPQPAERPVSMPPSVGGAARLTPQASGVALVGPEADSQPAAALRGLRSPAIAGSALVHAKPIAVKPLGKLGALNAPGSRLSTGGVGIPAIVPSFLSPTKMAASSSAPNKAEYGKTRTDDAPFLVEVLKGIVGLGIKVKVTPESHVQITEVQKNSPVDKNGQVKVGDYVLCVNTTELTGQSEGRVQQVLRLLPRGLIKLLVSTVPPVATTVGENASPNSTRTGGAYTQYGVRLSAQPFSTTRSDGKTSTHNVSSSSVTVEEPATRAAAVPTSTSPGPTSPTSPPRAATAPTRASPKATTAPISPPGAATAPTSPPRTSTAPTSPPGAAAAIAVIQPLSLSVSLDDKKVLDNEDEGDENHDVSDDDDDMTTRRLSKALSPRISNPEPFAFPSKPSPRPRAIPLPTCQSFPSRSDADIDDADLHPQDVTLRKVERRMTSREIVAAASKRPSGLAEEVLEPLPVPITGDNNAFLLNDPTSPVSSASCPRHIDPVIAGSISPPGFTSPREEAFAEAAKKTSPVPTPRPKPRSVSNSSDGWRNEINRNMSPTSPTENEPGHPTKLEQPERNGVDEVVHVSMVTITQAAAPPHLSAALTSKVPPPVAPKPKMTSSVSSETSANTRKELPSPKLVSPKLRNFAEAEVLTVEDQALNTKRVSSAARMFEQKSSDNVSCKTALQATRPKSTVSVSSVVKSFNQPEPEPVTHRHGGKKISLGHTVGVEGSTKPINSALMPVAERRKIMPTALSASSLSLTRPSALSQLSGRDTEPDSGYNAALRSRIGVSNTTSLKSLIGSREHRDVETRPPASPPPVGKSTRQEVTLRPRSYLHDARDPISAHSKRASWSAERPSSDGSDHSHRTPKMIFTSNSLHQTTSVPDKHLEFAMKSFDDLLSDKHHFDSDEDIPIVSNSVSLDLLKSRTAGKVAASSKYAEDSAASIQTPACEENIKSQESTHSEASPALKTTKEPVASTVRERGGKHRAEEVAITVTQLKDHRQDNDAADAPELAKVTEEEVVTEPPMAKRKDDDVVVTTKVESEDAYPDEDAVDPLEVEALLQSVPRQDTAVPQSVPKPEVNTLIQKQASSIVDQVIGKALEQIATIITTATTTSTPAMTFPRNICNSEERKIEDNNDSDESKETESELEDEDEADTAAAPPALPDQGPPPLPGAPPPPLIFTNTVENLVAKEDLDDLVPSQNFPSKRPPRDASADLGSSPVPRAVEATDDDLQVTDTVTASFSVPSMSSRALKKEAEPTLLTTTDTDVFNSINNGVSSPSETAPVPSYLLGGGLVSHYRKEEDDVHCDNHHAVSDTLSQDSGVQDEEMSEDGLRSSQDDSPTSHVDSLSVFETAETPDAVPMSVLNDDGVLGMCSQVDGVPPLDKNPKPDIHIDAHITKSPPPRPSPRSRTSPSPSLSPPSPKSPITSMPLSFHLTRESEVSTVLDLVEVDDSDPIRSVSQGSASPRCSSGLQQEQKATAPREGEERGGEGTKEDVVSKITDKSTARVDSVVQSPKDSEEQSLIVSKHDTKLSDSESHQDTPKTLLPKATPRKVAPPLTSPLIEKSSPQKRFAETPVDAHARKDPPAAPQLATDPGVRTSYDAEHDDCDETAEVVSSRKWCILDQSGSMFLNGAAGSRVPVARAQLRQVSSLKPREMAEMVEEGNKDLDLAHLPKTVELRIVAVRGLTGRPVTVEVTQREDYFVQVTRVHSKDSTLLEADILLSLDGRTLKHRRPAQVLAQVEGAGVKGVFLTARGPKLPPSVLQQLEERNQDASPGAAEEDSPPAALFSSASAPAALAAVEVGPGQYEVIMNKGATGVGFCLEGGRASPRGDLPIVIKRIFKGGPAEKCGQLKVKDEILAVNGVDFTVMRHYEAWNHLKFLDDGPIRIRIRRTTDN